MAAGSYAQNAANSPANVSENKGIADTTVSISADSSVVDTAINISDNNNTTDTANTDVNISKKRNTIDTDINTSGKKSITADTADIESADNDMTDIAAGTSKKNKGVTDTAISGKHYGFGAGLSLGSIPVFSMWKNALLDSLNRMNITPSFGRDSAANNTGDLRFNIIEAPEEFNFFIPFHVSMYNIKETHTASIGLSFFYNAKQSQAEIVPYLDENGRRVNIYETMKFYSLTLEAAWQVMVPQEYFSIKGQQKTFVSLALGVSPAQYITRYGDIIATESDTRMQAIADTAKKTMMPDFSANGASASWRIGIGTLKRLQNGCALEMGLYYSGAYIGYFFRDGDKIMKSAIYNMGEDERDNPISFVSNRIEFKVTYLVPVKREKKKKHEEPPQEEEEQSVQQDDESPSIRKHNRVKRARQDDENVQEGEPDNPTDSEDAQEQQEQSDDGENQEPREQPEEAAAE